ncbi:MAG: hypothetical protein JXQ73_20045 [Phycisphaerae bacterium]|nr:hypothetical protein [Phycisphaerae bacterium]
MRSLMIASLVMLAGPLTSLAGSDDDVMKVLRSRMARKHINMGRYVMAFYYPWYGTEKSGDRSRHWGNWDAAKKDAPQSLRWPVGGPYDSTDPAVVDRHMRQFAEAGIDVAIVSWWGPGDHTDKAMPIILDHAAKHGLKVTVYFEVVRSKPPTVESAVSDLDYLAGRYASHPAWLRVGSYPVIFLYGRVMGQLDEVEWIRALDLSRRQSGANWIAIADGIRAGYGALFDGIHGYNTMGSYLNQPESSWPEIARAHMTSAIRYARPNAHIACATIVPGYDDTKIRKPGAALDRADGRLYDAQWKVALETQPDWILITSFNEWHEGSEIEPSAELRDKYLKATAKWTKQWRQSKGKTPDSSAVKSTQEADAALRGVLDQKIRTRIGLLNGIGPVGMRLVRVTTRLDTVKPADLVGGKITPKTHRVLIYTSGEDYPTRVNSEDDVPKAIASYVAAGGSLIVFGDQPFPFFYDENRKAVNAGRIFDLHLLGSHQTKSGKPFDQDKGQAGFERPASDLGLMFAVAGELPSQPSVLPWPASGDQRWRPAYRPLDRDRDRPFWPLMKLVDKNGRDWGEAVAVFGSRDKQAGNVVYAWFRLADVVGLDGFLVDLLRLAVTPAHN